LIDFVDYAKVLVFTCTFLLSVLLRFPIKILEDTLKGNALVLRLFGCLIYSVIVGLDIAYMVNRIAM
jgi:hypothetical protein